jgi:hypothetical protein
MSTRRASNQVSCSSAISFARRNAVAPRSREPQPAEEAFKTAIPVARKQGARSYVPLGSLVLAKLYQSTARPAEIEARRLLETGDRDAIRDAILGWARP